MVMRLRKMLGSLNPAKPKENKPENNVVDSPEVHITELTSLEQVVEKTKDLEQTKEQLRQLSGAMYSSDGNDEAKVKAALAQLLNPDGLKVATLKITPEAGEEAPAPGPLPLPEIKDTPGAPAAAAPPLPIDLVLQTTKATADGGDGLQVSNAAAEPPVSPSQLPKDLKLQTVVTTSTPAEGESMPKTEGGGDMLSKIFDKEDEEANPLAALMASLPDVSLKDLLDEAKEVEGMLGEWQQN